jgi:hypothetical protein
MSVAASAGDLEYDAVVNGGEAFVRRLADLHGAATAYNGGLSAR